jgi:hypothetical protein
LREKKSYDRKWIHTKIKKNVSRKGAESQRIIWRN